jgi:hypothetical protein
LRIHDSALRHGSSREDISHAYDLFLYETVLDEDADPPKLLIIGPDGAGNPLELIGGEIENGDVLIWHAMACRKQYLDLLPDQGGES